MGKTRRSMADILQAHPSAGADRVVNYQKPATGLLGMHEKSTARRSSTMLNLSSPNLLGAQAQRAPSGGFKSGQFNDGQGGMVSSRSLVLATSTDSTLTASITKW